MADLKLGSTVGGAPIWSGTNLPLKPDGNILKYKEFIVYTSANPPGSGDLDAVARSGDTMTGQLIIDTADLENELLVKTSVDKKSRIRLSDSVNSGFVEFDSELNNALLIGTNDVTAIQIQQGSQNVHIKGILTTNAVQSNAVNSFTRKDYVDGLLSGLITQAGGHIKGSLIIENNTNNLFLRNVDRNKEYSFNVKADGFEIFNEVDNKSLVNFDATGRAVFNEAISATRSLSVSNLNTTQHSAMMVVTENAVGAPDPVTHPGVWYGLNITKSGNVGDGFQIIGNELSSKIAVRYGTGQWKVLSDSTHNHDTQYLKLSGGTLAGKLTVNTEVQVNNTLRIAQTASKQGLVVQGSSTTLNLSRIGKDGRVDSANSLTANEDGTWSIGSNKIFHDNYHPLSDKYAVPTPNFHLPLISDTHISKGKGITTFTRNSTTTFVDSQGVQQTAEINVPVFEDRGLRMWKQVTAARSIPAAQTKDTLQVSSLEINKSNFTIFCNLFLEDISADRPVLSGTSLKVVVRSTGMVDVLFGNTPYPTGVTIEHSTETKLGVVYTGSTLIIYKNGTPTSMVVPANTNSLTGSWYVGCDSTTNALCGYIKDLKVWNSVLTEEQVNIA